MANRTVKEAASVKGTNPQYLVEKITRLRVYESRFWKEECFALTAELLVDKAVALRYFGGAYGGKIKPTPFLCLLLKMLQIAPEKEIIIEFIKQEEFKYMRLLGALYMRMTASSLETYKYLEPLLNDYRKVRKMTKHGHFELTYMDEVIDEMLTSDMVIDITMPRLQKRYQLEESNELDLRVSLLDEDLEAENDEIGQASSGAESDNEKHADKKRHRHDSSSSSSSSSESSDDSRRRRRHRHDDSKRRRRSRSREHSRHRHKKRKHEKHSRRRHDSSDDERRRHRRRH